jgi:hypothetical protein
MWTVGGGLGIAAVMKVVAGAPGYKGLLFGPRWVRSRPVRGRERIQSLVAIGPAGGLGIAGGLEGRLESICLGFFSWRYVQPLFGVGGGLSRSSSR